ncbi:MAG: hypothetical protein ABIH66_12280 [bacterium]
MPRQIARTEQDIKFLNPMRVFLTTELKMECTFEFPFSGDSDATFPKPPFSPENRDSHRFYPGKQVQASQKTALPVPVFSCFSHTQNLYIENRFFAPDSNM